MKKNKIIYRSTTGIIGLMMLFSAYSYFTNPQVEEGFTHLGFPNYFRIELAFAKIIGAVILLLPFISTQIKEWAYAGFGIVFISATIAHFNSGDANAMVISPIIFLIILMVSNIYLHKLSKAKSELSINA